MGGLNTSINDQWVALKKLRVAVPRYALTLDNYPIEVQQTRLMQNVNLLELIGTLTK